MNSRELNNDEMSFGGAESVDSVVLLAALHHNHDGEVIRTLRELQGASEHEIVQVMKQRFPPWEAQA